VPAASLHLNRFIFLHAAASIYYAFAIIRSK
jgi:hypothetical protein